MSDAAAILRRLDRAVEAHPRAGQLGLGVNDASGFTSTSSNLSAGDPGGLLFPFVPTSNGPSILDHSTPWRDQSGAERLSPKGGAT